MRRWTSMACVLVAVAGSAAAGVVVGGQVRAPEPPKVVVANKVNDAVPVSAVVTRMPVVRLEPGTEVELSAATVADLKNNTVVKLARAEWEYRELRMPNVPSGYRSALAELSQTGAQGWETTGVSFSDKDSTIVILKRQK